MLAVVGVNLPNLIGLSAPYFIVLFLGILCMDMSCSVGKWEIMNSSGLEQSRTLDANPSPSEL